MKAGSVRNLLSYVNFMTIDSALLVVRTLWDACVGTCF